VTDCSFNLVLQVLREAVEHLSKEIGDLEDKLGAIQSDSDEDGVQAKAPLQRSSPLLSVPLASKQQMWECHVNARRQPMQCE